MKSFLIIFTLFSFNVQSAVSVKSCTGEIRYCDDIGICTDDYFYFYSYQVVKLNNNKPSKVKSRLRTRGSIGSAKDYVLTLELHKNRMIYLGVDYDLAIPILSEDSVLYRIKGSDWDELCP